MGGARVYLCENLKIKQVSIFDFGEFYKRLFSWFEVMDYDFSEKGYEKYDMGGGAENLKIYWTSSKMVDGYVKFVIDLSFFLIGMTKVEIEKDGLKIKTDKGTVEMRLTAYFEKDPSEKMVKAVGEAGRGIYEKFVIRHKMEDYEAHLYEELHLLMDEIKSYLSMHKF